MVLYTRTILSQFYFGPLTYVYRANSKLGLLNYFQTKLQN